jgi:hypothetical protein
MFDGPQRSSAATSIDAACSCWPLMQKAIGMSRIVSQPASYAADIDETSVRVYMLVFRHCSCLHCEPACWLGTGSGTAVASQVERHILHAAVALPGSQKLLSVYTTHHCIVSARLVATTRLHGASTMNCQWLGLVCGAADRPQQF